MKKYKPFKLKIRKKPTYKPIWYKKPKPYKRGRLLKSGLTQHMRVTCTGRRYWTPKIQNEFDKYLYIFQFSYSFFC